MTHRTVVLTLCSTEFGDRREVSPCDDRDPLGFKEPLSKEAIAKAQGVAQTHLSQLIPAITVESVSSPRVKWNPANIRGTPVPSPIQPMDVLTLGEFHLPSGDRQGVHRRPNRASLDRSEPYKRHILRSSDQENLKIDHL
jgi:hypothetical protein